MKIFVKVVLTTSMTPYENMVYTQRGLALTVCSKLLVLSRFAISGYPYNG